MEKKGLKPQNKYFVLLVVWFPNFVPLKMDVNFLIVLEKKKNLIKVNVKRDRFMVDTE